MRGTDDDAAVDPVPELAGLYANRPLPPELEERVVAGLVDHGLIGAQEGGTVDRTAEAEDREAAEQSRAPRPRPPWRAAILRAAAGLVLFAGGLWVGSARSAAPGPEGVVVEGGPSFMLLLWEGEGWSPPDDPEAVAAAYASWAGSLAGAGVTIAGDELGLERTLVGPASARRGENATIGGYFIIGAESAEEARALAEGHPHLANGGAIEIVPIVER